MVRKEDNTGALVYSTDLTNTYYQPILKCNDASPFLKFVNIVLSLQHEIEMVMFFRKKLENGLENWKKKNGKLKLARTVGPKIISRTKYVTPSLFPRRITAESVFPIFVEM